MKWLAGIVAGLILLVGWFVTANFGWRDVLWEIPANQTDFQVTFNHWPGPECPPLPSDPRHIIISIPPSGSRCTSSSDEPLRKMRTYRFIVVGADGTRTELPRDSDEHRKLLRSMTSSGSTMHFNVDGHPGRWMVQKTATASP